jgi:hypothetical protein
VDGLREPVEDHGHGDPRLHGPCLGVVGTVIAAAIDQDQESRQQFAEATGSPDAWETFALIRDGEEVWAAILALFAENLDHADAIRPVPGEPGYDAVFAKVGEYVIRIIRGAFAGNAACLPR